MEQIIRYFLRPLDRGEFQMEGLKTDAARKSDHLDDLKMDGFFADNALSFRPSHALPQTAA